MRILVTGGLGFIGSWLFEALTQAGHEVTVLDNMSPQIHGPLPGNNPAWVGMASKCIIRADIRNTEAVEQALSGVDALVHLAAETGTGQSMYRIGHYYDVNQQATARIFEAIARRHKCVRKIILASSRAIYGEGAYLLEGKLVVPAPRDPERLKSGKFEPLGPNNESLMCVATPEQAPPYPASIYAATKLANENLGRIFAESYGTSVVALRFQNVYGERQSLLNPYTGILSIFSNQMRQSLPINIFEDGYESRDFVHVSDVVQSIKLALEAEMPLYSVFNIGSGHATSVLKIANELKMLLESKSEIRITGDFRIGDIRHCYADISLARRLLGFEPKMALKMGLSAFCAWTQTQAVIPDKSAEAQKELAGVGLGKTTL